MSNGKTREELRDERYAALFEEGKVIQMYHEGKGVRWITNTEFAIKMARKRGYVDVEYVEETVKRPVVRKKEAAAPAAKKAASKAKE